MKPSEGEKQPLFSTPWFRVRAQEADGSMEPHYIIDAPDFVSIAALDSRGRLLLVRQFRPAVAGFTLELPSGHIEVGETPEQAAREELLEETGYEAETFELLGKLSPSPARVYPREDVQAARRRREELTATPKMCLLGA